MYSEKGLPPLVTGPARGLLTLTFTNLTLQGALTATCEPALRLCWWGYSDVEADILPLGIAADSQRIAYILRAGKGNTANYLRDAGALELALVTANQPGDVLATGLVDVTSAADEGGVHQVCTFRRNGALVGTVAVTVAATFKATSDGRNAGGEARATADQTMNIPDAEKEKGSLPSEPANVAVETPEIGADACVGPHPEAPQPPESMAQSPAYAADDLLAPSTSPAESLEGSQATQCGLRVQVLSAFHLPEYLVLDAPALAAAPHRVYASAAWQLHKLRRQYTHAVSVHNVPPVGATAFWNADLELEIGEAEFMDAAQREDSGLMEGPLLLINVWRSGAPDPDPQASLLEAVTLRDSPAPAVPSPFDELLGCAAVNLSSLLTDGQVAGRFPIVSSRHQVEGVIKACIRPNDQLAAVLLQEGLGAATAHDSDTGQEETAGTEAPGLPAAVNEAASPQMNLGLEVTPAAEAGVHHVAPTASPRRPPPMSLLEALQGPSPAPPRASHPHRAHQQPKVQYAWSGSDSDDDGAAMAVGTFFEGAISGSEDELDVAEESAGVGAAGITPRPRMLINQDWLFDITVGARPLEDEHVGDERAASDGPEAPEAVEAVDKPKKRNVVFKNRLLPGVVAWEHTYDVELSNPASEEQTGECVELPHATEEVAGVVPGVRQPSGPDPAPVRTVYHGDQHSEVWLFGIGRPASAHGVHVRREMALQAGGHGEGGVAACSQFAPMTGGGHAGGSTSGGGSGGAGKRLPGSPTLTQVLQDLASSQR